VLHILFRIHVSILHQQISWVGSVSYDVHAVNNSIIHRWLFVCILVDYLRFQNHMHLKIFRESAFQLKCYSGFIFSPIKNPMFETVENFHHFKCWKCAYLGVKFRHYFNEAQWLIFLVKKLYHENCGLAKSKELIKINLMWTLLKSSECFKFECVDRLNRQHLF
jgi:hypothetical protein